MSDSRSIIADADRIEARIVEAEKLRTALEEIKRLHAPVQVCNGCHLRECPGDCDSDWNWAEHLTEIICSVCCFDERDAARGTWCIEAHDHFNDATCSTTDILARAGL